MALGFISTFGIATLVTWCDWIVELLDLEAGRCSGGI